ncbi:multiple inositol polyphosphate phosphatase 1-like [Denticeps clupeoides]|uniref:Multiple inositol polyphosphate phosphatase 1 n=1 Tax=Denticeps clupeoides TaxID=299321 RepID=A0AAY4C404_9TELE|nr:multiple inositol polyphosphate phosphatase 1-like [Denticeps clupeoides]
MSPLGLLVSSLYLLCCVASSFGDGVPAIAPFFGTKGRYEEASPRPATDVPAADAPSPACRALHLTAVVRHGTRYPSAASARKMRRVYSLAQAAGGNRDVVSGALGYSEDMDGRLAEKGRGDHGDLAVRLARSFPSLLTERNLRAGRVRFVSSSKHRCVDSTVAFRRGLERLWGVGEDEKIGYEVNDALMRFFDHCPRFVERVEKNASALLEVELFKAGLEMNATRTKLADRLKVPYVNFTADMVEAAFYLCSYDFTIHGHISPWCHLFDEADAQVMEYAGDLKQYWKRGYGHDINRQSSCILFHDLFSRLDRADNESSYGEVSEAVTVQVGHAETLLPLLTLMGLFKDDEALDSTNFATQGNRTFRSGRMVPYAANLVMVLYDCPEGRRLQAHLNEKPLTLPRFQELSPLYEEVKRTYKHLLQGCNPESVCQLPAKQ